MHTVHEGVAYWIEGSPVSAKRPNKPHIAKRFGRWYDSGNGEFKPRVQSKRFCDRKNKELDNENNC